MSKKNTITLIVIYLVLFVLMIGCAYLFSSCTVTRRSRSLIKDSTSVIKKDSGVINKSSTEVKDSVAWWREIVNFAKPDTIINQTHNYPVQIIREGGTRLLQEKKINYDSIWSSRLDSLTILFRQSSNDKKTTVLGFWQILGITACVGLFFFILGKLKFR